MKRQVAQAMRGLDAMWLLLAMLLGFAGPAVAIARGFDAEKPQIVYLTLRNSPTELSVHWISSDLQPPRSVVEYRRLGPDAAPLQPPVGRRVELVVDEGSLDGRRYFVHHVMLPPLEAATSYAIRVPTIDRPVIYRPGPLDHPTIAIGGDLSPTAGAVRQALASVADREPRPQWLVLAGNTTQSAGRTDGEQLRRWLALLADVTDTLSFPDAGADGEPASAIPLNMLPGRRDIDFKQPISPARAGYLAELFPQVQQLPRAVEFDETLRVLLLDAGYIHPIDGEHQKQLKRLLDFSFPGWVVPVYAESAYPAAKKLDSVGSLVLRRQWSPLFEEAGVRLAVEHYDRAYKRSQPMRQDGVDSRGVVYVGGGALGRAEGELDEVAPPGDAGWIRPNRPYLARSRSVGHFITLSLNAPAQADAGQAIRPGRFELQVSAVGNQGELLDQLTLSPERLTRIDRTFFAMPHSKPEVWLLLGLAVMAVLLWLFLRHQERRKARR